MSEQLWGRTPCQISSDHTMKDCRPNSAISNWFSGAKTKRHFCRYSIWPWASPNFQQILLMMFTARTSFNLAVQKRNWNNSHSSPLNCFFKEIDHKFLWVILTIASIWHENMHRYLSADIICSEKHTVFREGSSRKTVSHEEQITSKDKYPSIFSPQMKAIVFIILQIFFATCAILKLGNIKQLLDEVEHDIMNYQNRGLCDLSKPKAEADNTDMRFW